MLVDIYKAAWLDSAHTDALERKVQGPRSEVGHPSHTTHAHFLARLL